jgi:hypothetical protein
MADELRPKYDLRARLTDGKTLAVATVMPSDVRALLDCGPPSHGAAERQ